MSGASGSGSVSGTCNQCGLAGHYEVDCPDLPCSRCRGTRHIQAACTTPAGEVCFICGQTGHYARACPTPTVRAPRCQTCGGYGHGTGTPSHPTCATTPVLPLCKLCNQRHYARDCQHASRPIQYSQWSGAQVCTQCGLGGHTFSNCRTKI